MTMTKNKFLPPLSGYVEGQGFLYQVAAKWKLTGALLFLIGIAFSGWQGLFILALLCLWALRVSNISLREYLSGLKPFVWFFELSVL